MQTKVNRAAGVVATAALAALGAGCASKGSHKEIVIRFLDRDRCVVFGEKMAAGELSARLRAEQDTSGVFDVMDFKIVMAPGLSEEDCEAVETRTASLIRQLGAGDEIAFVRESHVIVRVLCSFWFWVLVIAGAGAGYFVRKKKAQQAAS